MKIRLHTRAQNSAGERVRIALNLKNVEFEYVPIASTTAPSYISRNPQGLMPTLEVDGVCVSQSLAVIELLEEIFPEPTLYPREPIPRAQSRSFALAICSELHAITVHRVRKYLSKNCDANEQDIAHWYAYWTRTTLGSLEKILSVRKLSTEFCFADYPTVADLALVPQIANARRFNIDLSHFPILTRIDSRCAAMPEFLAARPENQIDYSQ